MKCKEHKPLLTSPYQGREKTFSSFPLTRGIEGVCFPSPDKGRLGGVYSPIPTKFFKISTPFSHDFSG
jgi:hypothetical protein